jgi:hypothetical protein
VLQYRSDQQNPLDGARVSVVDEEEWTTKSLVESSRIESNRVHPLDLLCAVILIITLTPLALEAPKHLRSHTNSLSDFELGHLRPHMGDLANDLVPGDDEVRVQPAPTARHGVDVGAAHAAKVDVEGDVVRTGGLERV